MKKLVFVLILVAVPLYAQRFRSDDPVRVDNDSAVRVESVARQPAEAYYDFVLNTFSKPGIHPAGPAANANTLGEVPDSSWFHNRHGQSRMTPAQLATGPNTTSGPRTPWTLIGIKEEGITPGLRVRDALGEKYLLKFDPPNNPEMASAAEVISTKILYAAGFNVPENYISIFRRSDLTVDPAIFPASGKQLDSVFRRLVARSDGTYRAMASKWIAGTVAGPFEFFGTRPDDPNDIIPHEDRRELRGLRVIASWLDHNDVKSLNTLDTLVSEAPRQYLRHYLIDFGSTLGSAGDAPQDHSAGWEYIWDPASTLLRATTLGLLDHKWVRARYSEAPSIGRLDMKHFDPAGWKPRYPNPAFRNAQAEDCYWAAKIVMAFTDDDVRTVVHTGNLSDPGAEEKLVDWLIQRRDKIGSYWLNRLNSLDHFELTPDGDLHFDHLASLYGFAEPPAGHSISWATDEYSNRLATISTAGSPEVIRVYVRDSALGSSIVGIERKARGGR